MPGTAWSSSAALSATRRRRNHVKKIIGKPCAGKPHARIERGQGKRILTDTAPLTTNEELDLRVHAFGGSVAVGHGQARDRRVAVFVLSVEVGVEAGQCVARVVAIQLGRSWPRRWVRMAANSRTRAARVVISGQAAIRSSRWRRVWSGRPAGRLRSQETRRRGAGATRSGSARPWLM